MLTNAHLPAGAAYAMAGIYLNPTSTGSPSTVPEARKGNVMDQKRDHDAETPHAVRAAPVSGQSDQLEPHVADAENRQEALIDEGVEEAFPASDPVSAKRIT